MRSSSTGWPASHVSERPRDRLGRPLAWDAEGFPGIEQRTTISSADAMAEARAYLDNELPFHAHEVFEQRWRTAAGPERESWRALAQWGAALTHRARGNTEGARRLAERAQSTWAQAPDLPSIPAGRLLVESCRRLATDDD